MHSVCLCMSVYLCDNVFSKLFLDWVGDIVTFYPWMFLPISSKNRNILLFNHNTTTTANKLCFYWKNNVLEKIIYKLCHHFQYPATNWGISDSSLSHFPGLTCPVFGGLRLSAFSPKLSSFFLQEDHIPIFISFMPGCPYFSLLSSLCTVRLRYNLL